MTISSAFSFRTVKTSIKGLKKQKIFLGLYYMKYTFVNEYLNSRGSLKYISFIFSVSVSSNFANNSSAVRPFGVLGAGLADKFTLKRPDCRMGDEEICMVYYTRRQQ